jgi:type VI protein secretion system component VasK
MAKVDPSLTRRDMLGIAGLVAVGVVVNALIEFGDGRLLAGLLIGVFLLMWLACYLEQREARRNAWRWDLHEARMDRIEVRERGAAAKSSAEPQGAGKPPG